MQGLAIRFLSVVCGNTVALGLMAIIVYPFTGCARQSEERASSGLSTPRVRLLVLACMIACAILVTALSLIMNGLPFGRWAVPGLVSAVGMLCLMSYGGWTGYLMFRKQGIPHLGLLLGMWLFGGGLSSLWIGRVISILAPG